MMSNNILTKIIIYNYLYDNINYKNDKFLYNISLSIQTITRQLPLYIFNKKKEVTGTKTTLIGKNLLEFVYKFKIFTLTKLYKTSIFYKNIYNFDSNFNLDVCLNNRSYFFEYFNSSNLDHVCKFNIKFIFNKYLNNLIKLNYIKNNLNFKL
uniref:Ribosomal protein L5 n=1 Tax=Babesia sp. Dunhuang TaxID=1164853 RepID=A0A411ADB2_9APIC|nr:ribosomal protein L5 [Babesia sp. Xinjiang]QAX26971.1 ribosomal protein L5 [Babesia sp. Xinjiang]QAX27002.1 ribosomal protein L5 [Babesia sp. Dunhuang]